MQAASEESGATRPSGPIIAAMPVYNEEETVGSVVLQAKRHVDKVLCLDDGSSDASARIARKCGAQVHQHRYNRPSEPSSHRALISISPPGRILPTSHYAAHLLENLRILSPYQGGDLQRGCANPSPGRHPAKLLPMPPV